MALLKTRYRIEGMDCGSCAAKIETATRRVDGVAEVTVSVVQRSTVLAWPQFAPPPLLPPPTGTARGDLVFTIPIKAADSFSP